MNIQYIYFIMIVGFELKRDCFAFARNDIPYGQNLCDFRMQKYY